MNPSGLSYVKRFFKRIGASFQMKLLFLFIAATIIPLGILGSISYTKFFSTVWDYTSISTIQIAEQLNKNIELLFTDTEKFLEIGDHDSTMRFLMEERETYFESKDILNIFSLYRNNYKFNQSIVRISVLGVNGKCINERDGFYVLDDARLDSSVAFNTLVSAPRAAQILPIHTPDYTRRGTGDSVISIGKPIVRKVTHEVLGVMIIDLDPTVIADFCNNMKIGDQGYFVVYDNNSQLIYAPPGAYESPHSVIQYPEDSSKREKGSMIEKIGGEKTFIVFNTSEKTGWKIVGHVALNDLMKSAYDIRNLTFAISALCLIISVAFYITISANLMQPINNLKTEMRLAESGNLDVQVAEKGDDEIADLCRSFNKMIARIRYLMAESIKEQKNLKKAEFKVMQAQINPHFLYNTLDTIVWLAASKKVDQVIRVTEAFSGFFRITLSKGKEWITVREEMEHVRNYLTIQKIRYRDILDYRIEVDDEILGYKMLKLVFQPLVENALYHGLKNKKSRSIGLICVKGFRDGESGLRFEVIDNGKGIGEAELRDIREELEKDSLEIASKDSGFGLNNVHRRIKLYYGNEYGLQVESRYEEGTTVTVRVKAERSMEIAKQTGGVDVPGSVAGTAE